MRYLVLALLFVPTVALADAPSDVCNAEAVAINQDARAPLFDKLKDAGSENEAQQLTTRLWQVFTKAPDPHAQDLLDRGMRYIRYGEPDAAEPVLDQLVRYCPDYAEGWNQRAFARFLAGRYEEALSDIDKTLEIEPRHFGALAGRFLTFVKQDRPQLAEKALRDVLVVHPWAPERRMMPGEKI